MKNILEEGTQWKHENSGLREDGAPEKKAELERRIWIQDVI